MSIYLIGLLYMNQEANILYYEYFFYSLQYNFLLSSLYLHQYTQYNNHLLNFSLILNKLTSFATKINVLGFDLSI